ncbi:N-acetylmuramoyl-L-alanine amidase [Sinobaca qinghaiensis]|uniref:N-acetylmuramoyl-L-alanine amidase n=1 Tax=Sinobaca qinghaiensis TaxID=342944 RepID=A0A419V956_9BACL|nr:N-acetylmuramoyl-L-alanine amidase [Sinobaca qinghaiensis]RKD76493.1 N-acetylmuramoyl-L-alanine amidase [Sinobaca qinghaiensis]
MIRNCLKIVLPVLVALILFILVPLQSFAQDQRLSGSDRIGTAIELSKHGWDKSGSVIIARSDHPADALASAGLVAKTGAPVLLSKKGSLDSRLTAEIKRLGAKQVYLLGGTGAISGSVESSLKSQGVSVKRVSGDTRYTTAQSVNKEAGLGSASTAILVNGSTVADALSASGIAANKNLPIYLSRTNSTPVELPSTVKNVVIFGGTAAISSSVEQKLKSQGKSVQRISGADRYETSVNAAKWAKLSGKHNLIVRGTSVKSSAEDYPDAVASAGLSKKLGAPVILSHNSSPASVTKNYISSSSKTNLVLGGTTAISNKALNDLNVSLSSGGSTAPEDDSSLTSATISSPYEINVRSVANWSADILGTVKNGQGVEVYEVKDGWAKIKYGSSTGFIPGNYVNLTGGQPEPEPSVLAGKVISIDAGHGGNDPGAVANGLQEKELNLDVALRVEKRLKDLGATVIMTRKTDTFIELGQRARIANDAKASSFISIHGNAFNAAANGTETFHHPTSTEGRKLATALQTELIEELSTTNRGVKNNNFAVLRLTSMPSALVELGFLTNAAEAKRLKTNEFREKSAIAIVNGLETYYGSK